MASILVIDDDPQLTHLLSLALTKKGFSVDIAYSPESALEYAQKNEYALILQDVFFPNKDAGFKVMEAYYPFVNSHQTPIVLMTAMPFDLFSQEPNFDKYLSMAKLFVSKGDDIPQIADRVEEILKEQNTTS